MEKFSQLADENGHTILPGPQVREKAIIVFLGHIKKGCFFFYSMYFSM